MYQSDKQVKYIIFTEIPEKHLEHVLQDPVMLNRCDAIALMYDNEKEHLDFIRDNINILPQFVPKMLIQSKIDLV
jgi:hypothetical protein